MPRPDASTAPPAAAPAVTLGAELNVETLTVLGPGEPAPLRMRPDEDTLLRVIDGMIRLAVDGAERLLAAGEEAIVPAGTPHRLAGAVAEARVLTGFRAIRR